MELDKDRIKESLTEEDIHKILIDLGSKEPIHGNQYTTICHGGNKHKLYYYERSKSFHCYTDCSDTMDIFELVVRAKKQQGQDFTFPQAIQYVATLTGKAFGKIITLNNDKIDDFDWINRFKKKEKINTELPEYDPTVLDVFLPYPHEAWINENISYETMKKFGIRYYFRENEESIVIPHYDINNRLVGIRKRSLLEEEIKNGRKYMPVSVENKIYNHATSFNLFGLNKTKEAIKRLRKVAIFEGEKSVLKCEDYYGENNFSVACCSSNITTFHRDLLLSLGIEEVIICFDSPSEDTTKKDVEEYQERLLKLTRKFVPYLRTYIVYDKFGLLQPKDSPVDRGKDVLEQLMKCKYEIKTLNEVKM